jgi:hypothetical protein
MEKQMVDDVASSNPRSYDLGFSTWSLCKLSAFLICNLTVDKMSHSADMRNIFSNIE